MSDRAQYSHSHVESSCSPSSHTDNISPEDSPPTPRRLRSSLLGFALRHLSLKPTPGKVRHQGTKIPPQGLLSGVDLQRGKTEEEDSQQKLTFFETFEEESLRTSQELVDSLQSPPRMLRRFYSPTGRQLDYTSSLRPKGWQEGLLADARPRSAERAREPVAFGTPDLSTSQNVGLWLEKKKNLSPADDGTSDRSSGREEEDGADCGTNEVTKEETENWRKDEALLRAKIEMVEGKLYRLQAKKSNYERRLQQIMAKKEKVAGPIQQWLRPPAHHNQN